MMLVFESASEGAEHQQPFLILFEVAVHGTMNRVIKMT